MTVTSVREAWNDCEIFSRESASSFSLPRACSRYERMSVSGVRTRNANEKSAQGQTIDREERTGDGCFGQEEVRESSSRQQALFLSPNILSTKNDRQQDSQDSKNERRTMNRPKMRSST